MRGKHFPVRIDAHAGSVCLLQKFGEIVQVMAGNNDERPLFYIHRDGRRNGRAVRSRIGLVEKLHAFQVSLSEFHVEVEEFGNRMIGADRDESLIQKIVDFAVGFSESRGMMRVSGHSAQAEQKQGFQTADILVGGVPQIVQIERRIRSGSAFGNDIRVNAFFKRSNSRIVETYVRDCGKKRIDDERIALFRCALRGDKTGKSYKLPGQRILKMRGIFFFAADAVNCTAFSTGCLLALITKH